MDFLRARTLLVALAGHEKTALDWKRVGGLALGGAALTTGGLLAGGAFDRISEKLKAKVYFKKVLEKNKDLRKHKEQIKPYFRSLVNFAPDVARDPLAAGSFLRRMQAFPDVGLPLQDVSTLTKIRSDMSRRSGAGEAFRTLTNKGLDLDSRLLYPN